MSSYKYDDNAELGHGFGEFQFSEKTIRLGFIRKVYAILSIQLLISVGFIALFCYQKDVAEFSRANPGMMIGTMVVTFVAVIVLACCEGVRRRAPWNFVILAVFTLCESWMLGSIASFYTANEVLLAVGIVAAITLALTLFAMQTKYDFTTMGGMLLVMLVVFVLFGIIAGIAGARGNNVLNIVYASLGALLFGFYLVFDTQLMLGGKHKYSISPEEYIFAALNLYLDIINMFIYILSIIGSANRS
ncbi:protein lifeguard 1-like [Paramacrobiotus metropolitanus]|uniref:protein lifeguard 1-like n=1 Tax=Paramacrobiotus metropolitanus TaxID=2943436 RepID=UPI0024458AC0|nr:protein lifeguard 1-like [Paramacrobiotus metropolitanus]